MTIYGKSQSPTTPPTVEETTVSFNTCNICLEEDNISEADER